MNKVVEVDTTGADVIHSWAMPADGREDGRRARPPQPDLVQGDPDRHLLWPMLGTVRRAPRLHADRGEVVSDADYAAWLAASKKKFAALDDDATRVAVEIGNTAMTDLAFDAASRRRITAATTPIIPPAGGATSIRRTTRTSARCT